MSTSADDLRLDAFHALLGAHASLVARVEEALAAAALPPLGWYDVLSALHRAQDQALRPRDLGCHVTISQSGLTRLVDRIVDAGLIERRACERDRRGHYVVLTDAGDEMLGRMRPIYERELKAHFASLLNDEEAELLRSVLDRVRRDAVAEVAA